LVIVFAAVVLVTASAVHGIPIVKIFDGPAVTAVTSSAVKLDMIKAARLAAVMCVAKRDTPCPSSNRRWATKATLG